MAHQAGRRRTYPAWLVFVLILTNIATSGAFFAYIMASHPHATAPRPVPSSSAPRVPHKPAAPPVPHPRPLPHPAPRIAVVASWSAVHAPWNSTLAGIAAHYHVRGGYLALAQYNHLDPAAVIFPGEHLRIP